MKNSLSRPLVFYYAMSNCSSPPTERRYIIICKVSFLCKKIINLFIGNHIVGHENHR
jgi:hypothetical protein